MRENPTTRKERNKIILKQKETSKVYQLLRRSHTTKKTLPKHTNCKGSTTIRKHMDRLPKHINCKGSPSTQARHTRMPKHIKRSDIPTCHTEEVSSKFCNHQEVNKSHSRSIKWRGYKCRRYRHSTHQDHGNIFTRKTQMLIKSMRIPTFHKKSPMKHRHHTNGKEWTATKQENSSTITKEENSVTTAPS